MNPHALNLRHLRAVLAVINGGSISAAVHIVHLTQSAITQGIAKLEAQIGSPLFERHANGMAAASAARILGPRAAIALRLIGSGNVTAAQMRAFLALARAGSYAGASVATGLSEASLHRAVGELSIGLGQHLVERRGRNVRLTARGLAVARDFRLATAELRAALEELAALRGQEIGRIVVGAMPLSRARVLPRATVAFYALHPDADIAIVEGAYADLVGPLRDGDIDMMVGALRLPHADGDLVQQPLFVDRPVIVARSEHPLARANGVLDPAQLAAYPWVVSAPGTPLHGQWRTMFDDAGVPVPRVAVACGSVMMARQMLIESDFLTLLSRDQVTVEIEAGWLTQIADAPAGISRTIGVITRTDWRPTRLQARFLALLERAANGNS